MYSFIKNEPTVLDFCGVLCGGATCKQAALKVLVKQDWPYFWKRQKSKQLSYLQPLLWNNIIKQFTTWTILKNITKQYFTKYCKNTKKYEKRCLKLQKRKSCQYLSNLLFINQGQDYTIKIILQKSNWSVNISYLRSNLWSDWFKSLF